ncbi:MAG: hypothetical protein OXR62_00115 [Ahrensia sp.]|nr:hypothetical protein [Ahrensia sp.]
MKFSSLKTMAAALTLIAGGLMSQSSAAHAASDGIFFDAPGFSLGFYDGPRYGHRRGYRHARCTPRRALRKARRNGVRRAHILRVGHRGVIVAGRQWGDRVVIGFGKRRGCPVRFVRAR